MIDFSFTPEQISLRNKIIDFAQTNFNEGVIERDNNQEFDRSMWSKAGEILLPGLSIPEAYGGLGLDAISTMSALEALGYGCEDNGFSFAIGAHLLSCVVPIWLYGSEEQKQAYLPELSNGGLIIANAMTEENGGSDVFNMQSKVTKEEYKYVIEGEKIYISNGPVADLALAYFLTDPERGAIGGVSGMILTKKQFEASQQVDKMGLRSCMMGTIKFDNITVEAESLLGKEGAGMFIFNQSMIWERIGLSAIHIGTLLRLVERATYSVKRRNSQGKGLSNYQAVTHSIANIKAEVDSARWSMYHAAWCLQNKEKAGLYASVTKLKAGEIYKKSCVELLQLCGAKGYIKGNEFERSVRDAIASTLYSGTSEIQRNLIFGLMNGREL